MRAWHYLPLLLMMEWAIGTMTKHLFNTSFQVTLEPTAPWRRLSFYRRGRMPHRLCLLLVVCVAAACGGGERSVSPPTAPGPGPDTTPPGTVQRASLNVQVSIDADDAAVAQSLGLALAQPAGFRVTLTRQSTTGELPRVATSDGAGAVAFTGLLEGAYEIAVERPVSVAERAALSDADRDVSVLAGSARVVLSPGTNRADIATIAARAGSLVISEIWPYLQENPWYRWGTYLEIYNNADTVVYLDGMLLGASSAFPDESQTGNSCERYSAIRLNSDELAAMQLWQFPGSGQQFPVQPGAAVIVAEDAIDHRSFSTYGVDLSAADFETVGDDRDTDNPAVPNLIRIRGIIGLEGRGWPFGRFLPGVYMLARRPSASLVRRDVGDALDVPFIPRDLVLDVAGFTRSPAVTALFASLGLIMRDCDPFLQPVFERGPAPFADANRYNEPIAYERRSAYTRPDGRVILQRTRTTARDWVYGAPATPGFVR